MPILYKTNPTKFILINTSCLCSPHATMSWAVNKDGVGWGQLCGVGWNKYTKKTERPGPLYPVGNWRRVEFIGVETAILTQKMDETSERWGLAAYTSVQSNTKIPGALQDVQHIAQILRKKRVQSWPVIPPTIKATLQLTAKGLFRKEQISIEVTSCGNLEFSNYNHVYCQLCEHTMLLELA